MAYAETIEQLARHQAELSEEHRLKRAGLKPWPDEVGVYDRHRDLFTQERVTEVKSTIDATWNRNERERLERTLFFLLDGHVRVRELPVEVELRKQQDELSAEVDGERVPYPEFKHRIIRETDPGRRERLRATYVRLTDELAPRRLELEQIRRQDLAFFGFRSPRDYAETKKHVEYDELLKKTIPILEETTGLYRRIMSESVRSAYGYELGEVPAAHAVHWRAGHEFDQLFPAGAIVSQCRSAFSALGLDLEAGGHVRLDLDERSRPGRRTSCIAARIPDEVHLITRFQGGYEGARSLMHAGGHALHFAHTDAKLPFEYRSLPRSLALTETFSLVMEHLSENPLWLEHALHVPKDISGRLAAWALLGDLFRLRRHVAKFTCSLAFDQRPGNSHANRETYAKTLRELTGFAYEPELYLEDLDPEFRAADRLRARLSAAQLEEHLTRAYGDRWFLKRESGNFLKSLYAHGVAWEAEDLVRHLGMQPWDPKPLIRKYDGVAKLLK